MKKLIGSFFISFAFVASMISFLFITSSDSGKAHIKEDLAKDWYLFVMMPLVFGISVHGMRYQMIESRSRKKAASKIPFPVSYINQPMLSGGYLFFHCNKPGCDGYLARTMFFADRSQVDTRTGRVKVWTADNSREMSAETYQKYRGMFKDDPCFCIKCGTQHDDVKTITQRNPLNLFNLGAS